MTPRSSDTKPKPQPRVPGPDRTRSAGAPRSLCHALGSEERCGDVRATGGLVARADEILGQGNGESIPVTVLGRACSCPPGLPGPETGDWGPGPTPRGGCGSPAGARLATSGQLRRRAGAQASSSEQVGPRARSCPGSGGDPESAPSSSPRALRTGRNAFL